MRRRALKSVKMGSSYTIEDPGVSRENVMLSFGAEPVEIFSGEGEGRSPGLGFFKEFLAGITTGGWNLKPPDFEEGFFVIYEITRMAPIRSAIMITLIIILISQDLAKYSCPGKCIIFFSGFEIVSICGFGSEYSLEVSGSSSRISLSLSRGNLHTGQNQLSLGTAVLQDGHVLACSSISTAFGVLLVNNNKIFLLCL